MPLKLILFNLLAIVHQLVMIHLELDPLLRSQLNLLDNLILLIKHFLNGLELHEFLPDLLGEELWVHLGLVWVARVLHSV